MLHINGGKYLCAFRGRRDYYQVAIALAESELLEEFVTDAYAGKILRAISTLLPGRTREKISSRYDARLPESLVRSAWYSAATEQFRNQMGINSWATFAVVDRMFGEIVAARARRKKCNLLVYSPYAWEPFTSHYEHQPKKILFQFHPHPAAEQEILLRDVHRFPFVRQSYELETGEGVTEELKR